MNKELLDKLGMLFENPIVINSKDILPEANNLSAEANETLERYMKKWNIEIRPETV